MKRVTRFLGCALGAALFSGCYGSFCDERPNQCYRGTGGTSTSSATGTSTTGIVPNCTPTEGATIDAACGVFVKAGATGNGTQASPTGDLKSAAANTKGAIYICGGDTFTGSITIVSGLSIYGGFDCASWSFKSSNAHPVVAGDADMPAVTISGGSAKSTLAGVDITAPNATIGGGSSVAVFAVGATVAFDHVALTAGNGAKGMDGVDGGMQSSPAASGNPGTGAGSTMPGNAGGKASDTNTCGDGATNGGKGGDGGPVGTNPGGIGSAGDMGSGGLGGFGDNGSGTWSCAVGAPNGGVNPGPNGGKGSTGVGAATSAYGALSSTLYANAPGTDGTSGTRGKGGGGGGGSGSNMTTNGAGGGGGGAGGCGGKQGTGGGGGGSSIGVLSHDSSLTLTNVFIALGTGGDGGKGGNGQLGQHGGSGGAAGNGGAVHDGCPGGTGGDGGNGGPGGGGRGGHAVGVLYAGSAPTGAATLNPPGTAGVGGIGGTNGTDMATSGAPGVVAATQMVAGQ